MEAMMRSQQLDSTVQFVSLSSEGDTRTRGSLAAPAGALGTFAPAPAPALALATGKVGSNG